jgi:hypothetical protein
MRVQRLDSFFGFYLVSLSEGNEREPITKSTGCGRNLDRFSSKQRKSVATCLLVDDRLPRASFLIEGSLKMLAFVRRANAVPPVNLALSALTERRLIRSL